MEYNFKSPQAYRFSNQQVAEYLGISLATLKRRKRNLINPSTGRRYDCSKLLEFMKFLEAARNTL